MRPYYPDGLGTARMGSDSPRSWMSSKRNQWFTNIYFYPIVAGCGLPLPFEFVVPDLLYERGLKGHGGERLLERGMRIEELDGDGVMQALSYRRRRPALSLADCFAFVLAVRGRWILLTGDAELRRVEMGPGKEPLMLKHADDDAGRDPLPFGERPDRELAARRRCDELFPLAPAWAPPVPPRCFRHLVARCWKRTDAGTATR